MNLHSKLVHIDAMEYYQFVSFRTYESVDKYVQKILQDNTQSSSHLQYKLDKYLDSSSSGAILNGDILDSLYQFFLHEDHKIYNLISFSIMPNHVHILFKQTTALADTIKSLKAKSAIRLNKLLNTQGKFWANGYYDKLIRDEKHFDIVYNYIKNNPLKVNLDLNSRFYSIYE